MTVDVRILLQAKKRFTPMLFLALFMPCITFALDFDDISITTISAPTAASYHGYAEWSFMITNTSAKKAHTVSLRVPNQVYGGGDHIIGITRTITVGPRSSARMSLFQPAVGMQGNNISVYIDGRMHRNTINMNVNMHASNIYHPSGSARPACVLLSKNASYDDFAKGTAPIPSPTSGRSSSPASQISFQRSEMSLSEWSTDWLGYSRYDGVVVTGSDMEKMPVTVRNAIFDYVQCGGTLLVLGDWQGSAEWKGNTAKDEPFDVRSGPFDAKAKGFGLCIIDDSETSTWDNVKWSFLISSIWNKTSAPFMNNMTVKVANTDFPVVSDLKIPAKGLLLLVILFAVAMGPANIYILSKMKRRIWLLWTVPVIAIFASVSVFAYATLAEGWAGVRKSETVTILDEQQHKAYTIGVCAFYSPLTPRRGLLFDYATEVTAVAVQQSFGGGRPRTLVLTDGQNFDSGWVRARVPAHFLVRKSETRRERVKLSIDEKGHISAVNGLGGDVKTLWYMDNDGMIFKAENIPAGSRASLSASGSQVKTSKNQNPRRFFSENNWVRAFVNNDPMSFLSRNTYVAEVEDSLFLEQGLENVKKDDSRSIVIGLLKGDLDAG